MVYNIFRKEQMNLPDFEGMSFWIELVKMHHQMPEIVQKEVEASLPESTLNLLKKFNDIYF